MEQFPHAVFRTDAGPRIGGGHLSRCLVLAHELKAKGWSVTFVMTRSGESSFRRAKTSGIELVVIDEDALDSSDALRGAINGTCALLVIDHYRLGAAFESALKDWAAEILVIDDLADRQHDCGILIDPSPGRIAADYEGLVPPNCKLLLGAGFALLRKEFAEYRLKALNRKASSARALRLLVSFGMTNPMDAIFAVMDALEHCPPDLEVCLVLGSARTRGELDRRISGLRQSVAVLESPENLAAVMLEADIAIGAAGGSALERCCLALPAITVSIAANQEFNLISLAENGASITVASTTDRDAIARAINELTANEFRRTEMAAAAAAVCDGLGATRSMLALAPETNLSGESVTSRPATFDDMDMMFEWQTSPGVRKFSGNPTAPTWEEHCTWFERRMRAQPGLFEIILLGNTPAGMIRLDQLEGKEDAFQVSILIAPEYQGQGVGGATLRVARRLVPHGEFHANIHKNNHSSRKIFSAAGYVPKGDVFLSRPVQSP